MTVIAIDCDLRKIYAWCDTCGVAICKKAPDLALIREHIRLHLSDEPITVLYEIAGPVDYTDNKAIAHNKRRWTIWNVAMAAYLDAVKLSQVLVSPSSTWTSGYPIEARHKLAKADYPQKDIRECQAMVWSYRLNPKSWTTLGDFLARL
jgi:hypothetical protein